MNSWFATKADNEKSSLLDSELSLNDILNIEGMLSICKVCEFDMNIIKIFIDEKITSRTTKYKYYKEYADLIDSYNEFHK